MTGVLIPSRFNGPPGSANGGYACGLVARLLGGGAAEVRLRRPPPLDRPLRWDGRRLLDGDDVVAEGWRHPDAGRPAGLPPPLSLREATAASTRFPGFVAHPFPSCFGCGPERDQGDGLRLFPGPVDGRGLVAAPWVPHPSLLARDGVALEVVWAALDCVGGWAGLADVADAPGAGAVEGTYVLGTMRGAVERWAAVDQPHVALGWQGGVEGRKLECGSVLYTAIGELVGWSHQIWIRIAEPAAEVPQASEPARGA